MPEYVNMVKMQDFSSFVVHIKRFCANAAKCCAVAWLHNHDICFLCLEEHLDQIPVKQNNKKKYKIVFLEISWKKKLSMVLQLSAKHAYFCLIVHPSCVRSRVAPLDSETGWTGDFWFNCVFLLLTQPLWAKKNGFCKTKTNLCIGATIRIGQESQCLPFGAP